MNKHINKIKIPAYRLLYASSLKITSTSEFYFRLYSTSERKYFAKIIWILRRKLPPWPDVVSFAFQRKQSRLPVKMTNMSSDLKMQNTIIDCYDMRKNEMFIIIDSLFNERIDY